MKVWKDDDPKASLMLRKRSLIIDSAREAFLTGGYAETSMDSIAKGAGVSIKTVYRHFDNKDDLFSAVTQAACSAADTSSTDQTWLERTPRNGLFLGGVMYLQHALSTDQLALYRLVIRDAGRFPELGKRYTQQVVEGRNALMVSYLKRWSSSQGWKIKDLSSAANAFVGLLRSGWFEAVLLGTEDVEEKPLQQHAKNAATHMLTLLESKKL